MKYWFDSLLLEKKDIAKCVIDVMENKGNDVSELVDISTIEPFPTCKTCPTLNVWEDATFCPALFVCVEADKYFCADHPDFASANRDKLSRFERGAK